MKKTNDCKINENERNEKDLLNSCALNKRPFYRHLYVSDIQRLGQQIIAKGIMCCFVFYGWRQESLIKFI